MVSLATVAQAAPIVIDNGDAGYGRSGNGFYSDLAGYGYQGDYRWGNFEEANPAQSTWQFDALVAGQYDVYVTWTTREFWNDEGTNVPFSVFDGTNAGANLGTVNIDESVEPVGVAYGGATWVKLGTYTISGAQLAVQLKTSATQNGSAIADAVYIEAAAVPEPASLGMAVIAGGLLVGRRRHSW